MRYSRIELRDFKPFQCSGIGRLVLKTEADIQIIIGTNGSGKSTLLREITPLPASRSIYGPEGYKSLTLEHEGSTYCLTSDFTNRSAPHSFVKDGSELNESGVTAIQEELVVRYLGYTKDIDGLTTGKYSVSRMTPGQRKELFLKLNPFDIGFMLDAHRKKVSEIRACKNNIAMLTERKAHLEVDLISDEEMSALRNNRQVIEDELAHAIEFLHSVDKGLEQLETREVGELLDADALIRLKREYGEIARQSAHWTNVSRSETDLYVKDLERQRGDTILTIEQLEQRGQELAQEIEEYRRDIGDVEDGDVTMLIQSISDLEAAIGEIDVESDLPVIPESQLASAEEAVSQLEKLCVLFYDLEIRLIDSATLRRKRHWLETRHRQMLDYSRQLQSVSEELASLVDQQKIMFKDIPTEPCAQMACPLYAAFMSEAKTSRRRTEELQERKRFLIHFVRRLTRYTDGVSAQIDQMQRYLPDVMAVARIIKDYPQFDAALKGQPLTERLMQNPSSISRYARDTLTHSQSQVEKARLENELERARILYEKVKSVTDRDSGYLKQMVGKRETSLSTINLQIKQAKANLNSLESDLSNARDYLEACQRVVSITSRLENSIRETEYRAEADTLKALRSDICRVRDDRISKLGEIDHAIKRQDILKARYTEEVVAQMEIIEKTRSELMSIESALSPINGLPHGYTVQFLNHVIRIANLCIQEVFSYPFEVIPLSEDSDLDYRFQVKAGDAIVPDVSHCSAAQKEMIDFAFCLALIEVVDVRGYPIMLDEIGSAFDHRHQHQLLNLLQIIMTEERASSMFLVNHNEAVLGGLANAETLVLNDLNIIVPEDYNHHATINYIAESPA